MNIASLEQNNDDSFYAESCEHILEKAHEEIKQAEDLIENIKYILASLSGNVSTPSPFNSLCQLGLGR